MCANSCRIGPGEMGFCGVRKNEVGKLLGGPSPARAHVEWYYDPLPTNCVAEWVCPGGSNCGFPEFSHSPSPEYGYENLAVFFQACTMNCLFCQNWHFRQIRFESPWRGVEELVASLREKTSCICYFGGDPSAQMPFALEASRRALERRNGRILRICWETNGMMSWKFLEEALALSLETGGCVKFDLKAWTKEMSVALCGTSNERTLDNFTRASRFAEKRKAFPLIVASTLLVPGYVDEQEVGGLSRFIAGLDRAIPYSFLGFHPDFLMSDLPATSRRHAYRAREIAEGAGLQNVRIGNLHVLGDDYE